MVRTADLDCEQCGACCVNLPSNQELDFVFWVEIAPDDEILERSAMEKLIIHDDEGVPHLRIVGGGRCIALRGKLGRRVSCSIYHHRPSPCRKVQPGDEDCRRSRAAHGLT